MGRPVAPDAAQRASLEAASRLTETGPPRTVPVSAGRAELSLSLPRQSVSLLVLE